MTGLFISFEGVDGVGKTTQVERLRHYIQGQGIEAVVTREPGGTVLGRQLRELLLREKESGESSEAGADIAPRAEALMFAADRAQHVAEVISPALVRGAVVISDRYIDSSLAYQAGGRGLTVNEVRDLSLWATGGLLPARTYLLDMDPVASHRRLEHSSDRMESVGGGFQQRTREEFLNLAREASDRFCIVDAARSVGEVWESIVSDFAKLQSQR